MCVCVCFFLSRFVWQFIAICCVPPHVQVHIRVRVWVDIVIVSHVFSVFAQCEESLCVCMCPVHHGKSLKLSFSFAAPFYWANKCNPSADRITLTEMMTTKGNFRRWKKNRHHHQWHRRCCACLFYWSNTDHKPSNRNHPERILGVYHDQRLLNIASTIINCIMKKI